MFKPWGNDNDNGAKMEVKDLWMLNGSVDFLVAS